MGTDYDLGKEESYLMYYDVNNLYGAATSQYLPLSSFQWELEPIDFSIDSDDSPVGYIFEAGSEYPKEHHKTHKYIPLCPEYFVPHHRKQSKLMTTLLLNM